MKATVSWWGLDGSDQSIDSLQNYLLDEGVAPWRDVPGLRAKFWISDRETNRWGAVMLWDWLPDAGTLPPNRAAELIGYQPEVRLVAEVGAIVEGAGVSGLAPTELL